MLAQFSDINNDVALFVGWWDYMTLQKRLPVAAQVFQVCWYALNEEKLSPDADLGVVRTVCPDVRQQPRVEQKRRPRRVIEKYRKNRPPRRSCYRSLMVAAPIGDSTGVQTNYEP